MKSCSLASLKLSAPCNQNSSRTRIDENFFKIFYFSDDTFALRDRKDRLSFDDRFPSCVDVPVDDSGHRFLSSMAFLIPDTCFGLANGVWDPILSISFTIIEVFRFKIFWNFSGFLISVSILV